ncbi:hypothetical protein EBZ39_09965 [bacterium]|nr:hypothetical protein [bacterium]
MNSPAQIATTYYHAMASKDLAALTDLLAADVTLLSPLAKAAGKEEVAAAVGRFMSFFASLKIRACLEANDNQAMVVYDVHFPEPIGIVRTAALLTLRDGKVCASELFFDARPFVT